MSLFETGLAYRTGCLPGEGQRVLSRSKLIGAALALTIAAPLLVACGGGGFRPLYGPTANSGEKLADVLNKVDVAPIPGRVGQRIRNDINFYNSGGGDRLGGQYRLEVAIRESVASVMVKIDGSATGQIYNVDAVFKLVRIADNKVLFQGNSYARVPYQVDQVADPNTTQGTSTGRSIFANVRARHDAENRAAEVVAGDIKVRIAAFLSASG
jgi:LPS-assembly lipoprotein